MVSAAYGLLKITSYRFIVVSSREALRLEPM